MSTIDAPNSTAGDSCTATIVDPAAVARVRAGLADDSRVQRTTAIFSALADPTRFRILDALAPNSTEVLSIPSFYRGGSALKLLECPEVRAPPSIHTPLPPQHPPMMPHRMREQTAGRPDP